MKTSAGYSLIEVLIAFAIMAMVLAVMLPNSARLYTRLPDQKQRLLAHDYALSRLAQIGVVDELKPGTQTDQYRQGWHWTETIEFHELSSEEIPVYEVVVIIENRNGTQIARAAALKVLK